jgi:hypothetical protein
MKSVSGLVERRAKSSHSLGLGDGPRDAAGDELFDA